MVAVDVRVAHNVDKVAGREVTHVRHQAGKEGVARDVEGHPQPHVAGPLVHLAGQLALLGVDIELAEHVARRESHDAEIGRIPGTENNPSVVGICLDGVDAGSELIDALPGVVSVHVGVLGPKVPPLKSIHGPQIPLLAVSEADFGQVFLGTISVPNVNVLVPEQVGVGRAGNEPQQLLHDSPPEHALCREHRKGMPQVEPHARPELSDRARPSPVALHDALCENFPD
mmetsp:Transcript_2929/g.6853  ORF Transcript_2929/g.6853 Transcript_2929/m.6853 type:complete len:228 (-) Transcript_2929:853-1536(-)